MFTPRYTAKALLLGLVWSLAQATAPILSAGGSFLNTGLGPLSSASGGGSAPVLSLPTNGTPSTTGATVGGTTTEASGTYYAVADSSANMSGITIAQIEAGKNATGATAAGACNLVGITTTTPSCTLAGLTTNTAYTYVMVQLNSNGPSNIPTPGTFTTATSGATQIFTYPSGFAGSSGAITVCTNYGGLVGSTAVLIAANSGHSNGCAGYNTQVAINNGFTTNFTFQITGSTATAGGIANTSGMTFIVHDDPRGGIIGGDANLAGYGAFEQSSGNIPITNSIGIKFDISGAGYSMPPSGYANSVGLYLNGGYVAALVPDQDLNPFGVNINSGHIMAATVVYDGSLLTLTLMDTTTSAQARYSWPINIPVFTLSNNATVQFGAGNVSNTQINLLSWTFSTGYNPRLATPTFSVTPGHYTSTQSVTLSNCSGGVACYYTTNGLSPTSSSTAYTGTAISVASSEILQVVAIESGHTDSFVAQGNYQIASGGTPLINFPSGFSSYAGLINLVGRTSLSGSSLLLTDGTNPSSYGEVGGMWYVAPVTVSTFTNTSYQVNLNSGNARGTAFLIQNQPPAPSNTTTVFSISGGPYALGQAANSMGFGGSGITNMGGTMIPVQALGIYNSVAVIFGPINGSGCYTGVYTNGVLPAASDGTSINIGGTLNCQSGHNFNVVLTYNGTNLGISITDATTAANYTTSVAINIPSAVGGATAYVGFTGGDYGGAAQQINNWTWTP